MSTKIVKLHGGPWHGKKVELPSDQNHFHIAGPTDEVIEYFNPDTISPEATVPYREGMYSAAHGSTEDYEWDGWRGHE